MTIGDHQCPVAQTREGKTSEIDRFYGCLLKKKMEIIGAVRISSGKSFQAFISMHF